MSGGGRKLKGKSQSRLRDELTCLLRGICTALRARHLGQRNSSGGYLGSRLLLLALLGRTAIRGVLLLLIAVTLRTRLPSSVNVEALLGQGPMRPCSARESASRAAEESSTQSVL